VIRLATGIALCIAALITTVYGFLRLAGVLEQGGYGTPAVRNALIVLGVAGALLAGGIATIIWDISKRYEKSGVR
jgi:formate hydrogenlyase subunit 3/multisubunit Na+/H+ antiporter MnhD subunit